MIHIERGKEKEAFIAFANMAVAKLADREYSSFLALFDSSRLSETDLILALKYLDESRPILKIDDPIKCKCENRRIDIIPYKSGRGYAMDYDLTTNGEINDLTIQFEFLVEVEGYSVSLEDLHTL
ncbi:DUF7668 domain-containing protein [Clostridium amazonitimonense]|uniref:DUF7668 domain-containing protein n=1 Tax=Clostridium amazonitimonense TaxID=1499689 RepID=UPI0005097609|nr:hypothetical protein [Clostridium amazonitimonense]